AAVTAAVADLANREMAEGSRALAGREESAGAVRSRHPVQREPARSVQALRRDRTARAQVHSTPRIQQAWPGQAAADPVREVQGALVLAAREPAVQIPAAKRGAAGISPTRASPAGRHSVSPIKAPHHRALAR